MNLLSEPALRMLKLLTPEWITIPMKTYEKGNDVWNELESYNLIATSWDKGAMRVRLTKNAAPYNPSVFN